MLRAYLIDSRVCQNWVEFADLANIYLCAGLELPGASIRIVIQLSTIFVSWEQGEKRILILERKRSGARTQPYFSSVLESSCKNSDLHSERNLGGTPIFACFPEYLLAYGIKSFADLTKACINIYMLFSALDTNCHRTKVISEMALVSQKRVLRCGPWVYWA